MRKQPAQSIAFLLLSLPIGVRYALTVGLVGLATALGFAVTRYYHSGTFDVPFLTFYPAIAVAAWLGGIGPGILATLVSVCLIDYFWMPALLSPGNTNNANIVTLTLFVVMGVVVSLLNETWRRSNSRTEKKLAEALENETKAHQESADALAQVQRSQARKHFLLDASAALAELTDYESTLQRIASLAVPYFADWSAVDIIQPNGTVQRLAVQHIDPAKVQLAHELQGRYPPRESDSRGILKVLRTGEADWAFDIPDSWLEEGAQDAEQLAILRQLGLKSFICTPLRGRDKVHGALTFVMADSGRVYTEDDLVAAKDLANCAAIAIENATLIRSLRDADKQKDEFLAMLGHELRNPLSPIRNAVAILRTRCRVSPELKWVTDVIDRQSRQLMRLVDDLMDVSRIRAGKIELRKEPTELSAIVADAVEASASSIEKGRHELNVALPSEPIYLNADRSRLAQVLLNLLNNASKYTDDGGRIWVTAEQKDEAILIRVKDTGIGISGEMIPYIFDTFKQADQSMPRSQGGLGIGLSLARKFVELHDGQLQAFSDGIGHGSEFVVRLPTTAKLQCAAQPSVTIGAAGNHGCRYRILIVDDDVDSADGMSSLLQVDQHDARVAHDGANALQICRAFHPQVILLDIGLPGMDGYQVAQRIREQFHPYSAVLVAMTRYGQPEDRERTKKSGFDFHLVKPVDSDALKKLINSLVL